jgi:hypothetical protein
MQRFLIAGLVAGSLAVAAMPAAATMAPVANGGFLSTSLSPGQNSQFGGSVAPYDGVTITGWTGGGGSDLEALFWNGTATTSTDYAVSQYGDPRYYAWGATNGGAGAGNTFNGSAPAGVNSNIVSLDGDPGVPGEIYQTLNGLTSGDTYTVSFYWAAGQLENRQGDTTDRVAVTLGSGPAQSLYTSTQLYSYGTAAQCPTANLCLTQQDSVLSKGFSGWTRSTFTFTADASSEVLSFLALGAPAGEPPQIFLAGIGVPEPAAWTFMILGAGLVGASLRRRRALAVA